MLHIAGYFVSHQPTGALSQEALKAVLDFKDPDLCVSYFSKNPMELDLTRLPSADPRFTIEKGLTALDPEGNLTPIPQEQLNRFMSGLESFHFYNSNQTADYLFRKHGNYWTVDIIADIDPQKASQLLQQLTKGHPLFAFVADQEEYKNKHRMPARDIILNDGEPGSCEVTVGRDVKQHVPGLYYQVVFKKSYAKEYAGPRLTTRLKREAIQTRKIHDGDYQALFFQFYDNPFNWEAHQQNLSPLYAGGKFFSMTSLMEDWDEVTTEDQCKEFAVHNK